MAGLEAKTFEQPEETRPFAGHGQMELVHLGEMAVARSTYLPGWRWSKAGKPLAQTDSCQATHAGYVISGRMHIVMNDGTAQEIGPGHVVTVQPGHDAWVVGDEPCVLIDFGAGVAHFAERR